MNLGKIIKFWFPVVLYSGIIFYVSSWPSVRTPEILPFFDKWLHFCEYTLWGMFMAYAWHHSFPQQGLFQRCVWVVLLAYLYGLSDEYHQLFVVGRTADGLDLLADTLGGMAGAAIYPCIKFNTRKTK